VREWLNGRLLALALGLLAVLAVGGILGYAIGDSSRHTTNRHPLPASNTPPSPYGPPAAPIALRTLSGVSGIRGSASLQANGPNTRLTLNIVSRFRYGVFLYSTPHKLEELFASAPGRTENTHLISIQHLLGYKRIVVSVLVPSLHYRPREALEIHTSKLAGEVIR
jgi:hypothetical protein